MVVTLAYFTYDNFQSEYSRREKISSFINVISSQYGKVAERWNDASYEAGRIIQGEGGAGGTLPPGLDLAAVAIRKELIEAEKNNKNLEVPEYPEAEDVMKAHNDLMSSFGKFLNKPYQKFISESKNTPAILLRRNWLDLLNEFEQSGINQKSYAVQRAKKNLAKKFGVTFR